MEGKLEVYVNEVPTYPAAFVSWNDAKAFCRRLKHK